MLARRGPLPAGEIYGGFPASPPAISQHLKILRAAGLVRVERQAQRRIYSLDPGALRELEDWTEHITELWSRRFDALDQVLEVEKSKLLSGSDERRPDMENQKIKELTLTREFNAPRELVFKAWTDPGVLAQWWGPRDFTSLVSEVDARPGGAFLITMRGPDGLDNTVKGNFREVVPPERLVFVGSAVDLPNGVIQLETLNTVIFAEIAGRTRLTLHVEVITARPESEGMLAEMEAGWSQSLEKLAGIYK